MYDFYYDYDYSPYLDNYSSVTSNADAFATIGSFIGSMIAGFAFFFFIILAVSIVVIIAKWKLFKKAGQKPWESLIPIHSDIVEFELGGIETYWYFLNYLIVIPFIGWFLGWIPVVVLNFWRTIALSKAFGKGTGFGILMGFFPYICYPILAFGSAQYIGPQTNTSNYSNNDYSSNNYNNSNNDYQSHTNSYSSQSSFNNIQQNTSSMGYNNANQQPANKVATNPFHSTQTIPGTINNIQTTNDNTQQVHETINNSQSATETLNSNNSVTETFNRPQTIQSMPNTDLHIPTQQEPAIQHHEPSSFSSAQNQVTTNTSEQSTTTKSDFFGPTPNTQNSNETSQSSNPSSSTQQTNLFDFDAN